MGVMLSSPVELTRVQRRGSASFRSAVAEMQGWRTNHEDAHEMICNDKWGSFWVLDGHGGDGASIFCAPKLAEAGADLLRARQDALPADEDVAKFFIDVDSQFRSHVVSHPDQDSGSTVVGAVVLKLEDGTYSVKILNAGDSRGLVIAPPGATSKGEVTVRIPDHMKDEDPPVFPVLAGSIDHKPSHPVEKERIEAAGGFVSTDDPPRLDGNLAVSRGVGDFEYKTGAGKLPHKQKVSCVPDVYEVHGIKQGSIVVLACDGLWDVMTDNQVAEIVSEQLKNKPKSDLGVMCADLVHKALGDSSRDNITVMIIHLDDGTDWSRESNRFNPSDEIMHFEKIADRATDDDVKKHNSSILRKWQFPLHPVQCSVSGRWFNNMYKCPGTGQIYSNRHYQKKGWTKAKTGKDTGKKAGKDESW